MNALRQQLFSGPGFSLNQNGDIADLGGSVSPAQDRRDCRTA
jgi:hypothetical protein